MQFLSIKYTIIILFLFISCNSKKEEGHFMNDTGYNIEELKYCIRKNGDTVAYYYLEIELLDMKNGNDTFYVYSKIMADKYHYLPAYYNVYDCIRYSYDAVKKKTNRDNDDYLLSFDMDRDKREEALKYLHYGAEKRDEKSMWELGRYYRVGKFLKKDMEKAKKLTSNNHDLTK